MLEIDGYLFDPNHIHHTDHVDGWIDIHLADGRVCPVLDTTTNRLRLAHAQLLTAAEQDPGNAATHLARAQQCRALILDDYRSRAAPPPTDRRAPPPSRQW
jgi:hypothetical protein